MTAPPATGEAAVVPAPPGRLTQQLIGLAGLPGVSGAPTVWPADTTLLAWLRRLTVEQLYTWPFEETAARRWLSGDVLAVRALPPAPPFLAGADLPGLPAAHVAPLLRRLSLTRPPPAPGDLAPEALESLAGPVTRAARTPAERRWGQTGPDVPLLPATVEIPQIVHGIWLGGAPPPDGTLRANWAAAAARFRGVLELVLWTDLPRGTRDGVRDWAAEHGVHLVNVHEVFHATAPMALHTPYALELTKGLPRGWAAAADLLRVEVMYRFGGVYADGDISLLPASRPPPRAAPRPSGLYPAWQGPWHYTGMDRDAGPSDLPQLLRWVARSVPAFTLDRLGDDVVSNDLVVAPARHPALALWREQLRLNYLRSQASMFGGTRAAATPEAGRHGRPPTWAWAVTPARTGRVHRATLARLGIAPTDLTVPWPAVVCSNDLSWLPPPEGDQPVTDAAGDAVAVLLRCLTYLRWQLQAREGDLHLTGVSALVRGLPDPAAAWTALIGALPALTADLRPIQSITELRRNPDGSLDQVVLPPAAEALLDRSTRGTASIWLLDEYVSPVAWSAAVRNPREA